jgi:hypothetical protein
MIVSISCLFGLDFLYHFWDISKVCQYTYHRMEKNWGALTHIPKYKKTMQLELQKNIQGMTLPKTKARVGNDSIGYFGMLIGSILYNDLNYVPNPATISFASWNDWIMTTERDFFMDDKRAPSYLLFDLKTIDYRLPAQDDSLAQLEILHRYKIVDAEDGNLLLQRMNEQKPLSMSLVSKTNYNLGDMIDVPQNLEHPIWIKIKLNHGYTYRLMSALYKSSQYDIELLFNDGSTKKYNFMPRMAETGFLINPLISDNNDLLVNQTHYTAHHTHLQSNLSAVKQIRISCARKKRECAKNATVELDVVNGLS